MIHENLYNASIDYPDKSAVICGTEAVSYKNLENFSTKLANFLISIGVAKGDRIGIYSNKNIQEIIAIFAVMKAGGIFVHINPHLKENQLQHVLKDADIRILLIDQYKTKVFFKSVTDKCPVNTLISFAPNPQSDEEVSGKTYYINDILGATEPSNNKFSVSENDIAAIIYTSGSTGFPKGIIVTHKILNDSTATSASVLENTKDDRLISVTPFSFDGALSQLFTSVYVGGTIVQQRSNFPADIVKTLINEKITGFHAMPSLWGILLQKHSTFDKYDYPHLRYISIIGETFPQDHLNYLIKKLNKTKIYMMYGTTEAFRSTYLPPEDLNRKRTSAGIPFPGINIRIVNEQDNHCKPGEVGEIVHSGLLISPGYWKNSSKTAEVFKNGSLYTGDLGKLDEEGFLYFTGRKDSMFKSQGFRISPEEIEHCLLRIEAIQEAAVLNRPRVTELVRIKAFIVINNSDSLTSKEVLSHCRKNLPNYMIPNEVEFLSELPKTASNKINKSVLE
ncbi:MAG: AMP-binding protein [candidate division Zixibacteria bacterium]|nr:AMP-binding protein [candidate division Zixibacteria bacterium]